MTRRAIAVAVLSAALTIALYSDAQEATAPVTYQINMIQSVKKVGVRGVEFVAVTQTGQQVKLVMNGGIARGLSNSIRRLLGLPPGG
jgi:hypothetical protein